MVARAKTVPTVEVELPHVLAHRIAPHAAACPVADVIVHLAVVNQRAFPLVIVAAVLFVPCRGFDVVFLGDQVVDRHAGQRLGWVFDDLAAGTRAPFPTGDAVVAKVGKVGRRIVGVGRGDRLAKRGPDCHPVADEVAMLLNGLGHLRAEDAVPGLGVARLAKVVHRQGLPVLLIGGIVNVDVATWANDLILDLQLGPLWHGAWLSRYRH